MSYSLKWYIHVYTPPVITLISQPGCDRKKKKTCVDLGFWNEITVGACGAGDVEDFFAICKLIRKESTPTLFQFDALMLL